MTRALNEMQTMRFLLIAQPRACLRFCSARVLVGHSEGLERARADDAGVVGETKHSNVEG
jgi:hypothetical protein